MAQPLISSPTAGWYPDPAGSSELRFFDGEHWTSRLQPRPAVTASPASSLPPVSEAPWDNVRRVNTFTPPPSTQVRLSRSSLADLKRTSDVLTESVVERSSKHISTFAVVAGGLLLLYGLWVTVGTNWLAQREQAQLLAQYQSSHSAAPVASPTQTPSTDPGSTPSADPSAVPAFVFNREPMPTLPADGQPTGIIEIPSIGLKQVFVSGTEVPDLKLGPGVWKDGAFPGTPGNATISGHRTTYGGPFRHIDSLKPGDQIIIHVDGQPDAVFEVRGSTVVPPSHVQVTEQTPGVRLTLTTCDPVGSDKARLVVQAELVSGAWLDHALPAANWQIVQ